MQYGFILPLAEIEANLRLAQEVEEAGWDAVFVWEGLYGPDAWAMLAAIAMRTQRVRIGTMLTPVPRRRPWKLASETLTVDHLSNGRLILGVGLGAPDTGYDKVGEETDRKIRAELLDEGLDIITALWTGKPVTYEGKHYQVKDFSGMDSHKILSHIPIWVVGGWPRKKSMLRVARYDGLLPNKIVGNKPTTNVTPEDVLEAHAITPDDIREMKAFIDKHRTSTRPFDIVMEGTTPGDDPEAASAIVRPLAQAGATWWLEADWTGTTIEKLSKRIKQGPPRIDYQNTLDHQYIEQT
jgi:alkanesulfonate monooxygenase SsuD/methylene tetrahydromethanopterin reductase-like flavin-dependent oxidoreductase (luciferase family)